MSFDTDTQAGHVEEQQRRRNSPARLTLGDEEIRLLELRSATSSADPIECSLRMFSLAATPDYEAVSYVWGDQSLVEVARVNGVEKGITSNLRDLLVNLRHQEVIRTIWVDALCINQDDEQERYEQVKLMERIYREAACVVVFLGQAWDGVDIVCEYLKLAAQQADAHLDPTLDPYLEVRGQNISTPCLRGNLARFFSSEWFFRVWTVQEFVLAEQTSFIYGSTIFSGKYLQQGLVTMRQHTSARCCGPDVLLKCGEPFIDVMAHMNALNEMKKPPSGYPRDFLAALHHCRRRRCTDPRDRIYGMLGMAFTGQQGLTDLLPPDYSITVRDLFVKLARVQIELTKTLDVLSHASLGTSVEDSGLSLRLPSWVPDWTLQIENRLTHLLSADQYQTLPQYNASGGQAPQFHMDSDRAVSQGIIIDRIEALGMECYFLTYEDWHMTIRAVCEARQIAGLPIVPPKCFEAASATEIAFWRTLCGNLAVQVEDAGGELRRWRPAAISDFVDYLRWTRNPEEQAFRDALASNLSGRRFMRTSKGHFGLVAAESKPDDLVVVLAGGRKPYVLREEAVDDNPGYDVCYKFIGDGYVDGFMKGEALENDMGWTQFLLI